jgi:hypothetical protein
MLSARQIRSITYDQVNGALAEMRTTPPDQGMTGSPRTQPHKTGWAITDGEFWYGVRPLLGTTCFRAGLGHIATDRLSGATHANWRQHLEELGFSVFQDGSRPATPAARPAPGDLTREAVLAAAEAWSRQSDAFRQRRASRDYDLWINGHPYPVKAICILAYEHLGLGRPENWTKGGADSPWDQQLRGLGFEILPKGLVPASRWAPAANLDGAPMPAEPDDATLEVELEAVMTAAAVPTETQRLILARVGQGEFRRKLEQRWEHACALTGVRERAVLRAAHIQRWADSDNHARLDVDNGLLLRADIDGLFEYGLVTFNDDGQIDLSRLPSMTAEALGLHSRMRLRLPPNKAQRAYLAEHRARHAFGDDDEFNF